MRAAIVPLVLVLALVPLAAANEPPVAVAQHPESALLHEPVTFTSASFDADGLIVSTTWEFTDGRIHSGASVVYAFPYAGVHTVTLRVTDDDGATSALEIPFVVHATLMHGRAYALRAQGATLADTGDVATTSQTDHAAAVAEARFGQLRIAGLDATLRTLDDRAVARADVALVHIPVPVGYVLATGIEAESIVGCDHPTIANSKFTQLRLNDAPLVPPGTVAPNTRVDVPGGGLLELNVQQMVGDRLQVVALRFTSATGEIVEAAHAEAGVSHCPFA